MNKNTFKNNIFTSVILGSFILSAVALFEPEVVDAVTDSVVVTLGVNSEISINSPADTAMSTNLGVATHVAVATTTWTVITNNGTGYNFSVQASTQPAMQSGGNSVTDYHTGNPSIWTPTTTFAYFGYSATGTRVSTATWGTGNFCNGASTSTVGASLKYKGFTTSAAQVLNHTATTTPSGDFTTICYAVEQKDTFLPSGTYTATITATATANP